MNEKTPEQIIKALRQIPDLTAKDIRDRKGTILDNFPLWSALNINTVLNEVISFLEEDASNTIPSGPVCNFLEEIQSPEYPVRIKPPDWLFSDLDVNDMIHWLNTVTNHHS